MGFANIGAGRCYLHLQQHGSSCSGWTNIGGHLQVILYICFSIGSGSGQTFFKSPNIGKPYPLCVTLLTHPNKI
jgi:hypothetical protein